MSDVDDDLLALAGAGGGSETEDELPIKRKFENEEEEFKEEDLGSEAEEEESGQDEELAGRVPYPLEGKFRTEKDRQQLLALPEIEREQILFDRSQEMQRFEERKYLAQRARQRKQESAQTERQLRREREVVGVSGTKKNKLRELKRRRQERERREEESDYSMSDASDQDEYSAAGSGDEVEWAEADTTAAEEEVISVRDLNHIRVGKTLLARYCHYPQFEEAIVGSFVRVLIGFNQRKQKNIYRICQIKGVARHKVYTFQDRTVDEALVLSHAGSERTMQMTFSSDSPITEEEFEYWKNAMSQASLSLPSKRNIKQKFQEMRQLQRPLTDKEIEVMVARRQELSGNKGAQVVLQRASLQEQRDQANERGDEERVRKLDAELGELGLSGKRGEDERLKKLMIVNERNRRNNVSAIRKAEIQAQSERRKSGNAIKADPFSRLRTTARIYVDEDNAASAPIVTAIDAPTQKVTMSALDSVISSLDIKLEIEI